jgi:hypothetical protein
MEHLSLRDGNLLAIGRNGKPSRPNASQYFLYDL